MKPQDNHESVLCREAISSLITKKDGCYLDCTGGLGGHAAALLFQLTEQAKLWICDYHMESAQGLRTRFASDARVSVLHERFSRIFDNLNFPFDGILADLGISSPQLADETLGIGFLSDNAPLDMRIDHSLTLTATDILKHHTESDLADIFYYFGGEHASRKLARAIVTDRSQKKYYQTTGELRDLCARVLGRYYRGKKIHPATKIFQSLRIAVNQELDELKILLEKAPGHLAKDGKLVIISFHSGEDSLVKTRFRELKATGDFCLVEKKAIRPNENEVALNPRARSARMRVLEKL